MSSDTMTLRHNPFTILFNGLVGGGVGAISYPVANVPLLRHVPSAVWHSVKAIARATKIGPVLKTVAIVTVPIAAVATPPLVLLGSALFGLGRGAQVGVVEGLLHIPVKLWKDVGRADKTIVEELIPKLRDFQPAPLKEGEKPFDISPLRGIWSLAIGLVTAAIDTALLPLIYVRWLPQLWLKLTSLMLKEIDGLMMLSFSLLCWILGTAVLLIALPISALAGLGFGLVDGVRLTYTKGTAKALATIAARAADAYRFLRGVVG